MATITLVGLCLEH